MKKHLFLLVAGAIALCGCTSEDVVDDVKTSSRNAIKFQTAVSKPTRAVKDLTMDDLQKFHVFGFYTMPGDDTHAHAIFNNDEVVREGSGWSYGATSRYWVPDATYYFYAYSCGNVAKLGPDFGTFSVDMEDTNVAAANRVLKITNYLSDYTHQHDLIFASTDPYKAKDGLNDDVSFTFNHILSKLQAKFTTTFSSEYNLIISNVRFENIYNEGDYDFRNGWQDLNRKSESPMVYLQNTAGVGIGGTEMGEAALTVKNETLKDSENNEYKAYAESQCAYVIPCAYKEGNVYLKFNVQVKLNDDNVVTKELTATLKPVWETGKFYIYNVNIDPEDLKLGKITFTVNTINGWSEGSITPDPTPIDK